MEYSTYLANGWPIASGVIEGAVVILSKIVANFPECGGIRMALKICPLRAVAENGDWDNYHQYRRQQRHILLYGYTCFKPELLEVQAMNNDQ